MTIEKTMMEMREFYSPDEIRHFDNFVEHNSWDRTESWNFLRGQTVEDYQKKEQAPKILWYFYGLISAMED